MYCGDRTRSFKISFSKRENKFVTELRFGGYLYKYLLSKNKKTAIRKGVKFIEAEGTDQ